MGKVSGSYESRVGNIDVNWSFISDENYSDTVKIMIKTPVETIIELPDGNIHEVVAGEYNYLCTV